MRVSYIAVDFGPAEFAVDTVSRQFAVENFFPPLVYNIPLDKVVFHLEIQSSILLTQKGATERVPKCAHVFLGRCFVVCHAEQTRALYVHVRT